MANEHIKRTKKMGLGRETTSGTPVAAAIFIPAETAEFAPDFTKARDKSGAGSIVEQRGSVTVKEKSKVQLDGIGQDTLIGHLLYAALGTYFKCLYMNVASLVGVFTVGETVTGGTSAATGVVRRKRSTNKLYISVTSGTFTAAGETITGGTSGATATGTYDSAIRAHIFQLLNTNNHPAYTLWSKDDVETLKAAYGMLDQLDLMQKVDDYMHFKSAWSAKKKATDTASPAYTAENPFLGKHCSVAFDNALSGLDAASPTPLSEVNLTLKMNVKDYQAFGAGTDITSQHNQQFGIVGDLAAIFNSVTLRDYVSNSTKKAMRVELINTDATIGSASNPMLTIDLAQCSFADWSEEGGLDDLSMQKLGFESELSLTDGEAITAILLNAKTSDY
jgi:hypothetical protein